MKALIALALCLSLTGCPAAIGIGAAVLIAGPYLGVGASLASGLNALASMAVSIDKLRLDRNMRPLGCNNPAFNPSLPNNAPCRLP